MIRQLAPNCTASALEKNKLVWKMPICIFNVFDTIHMISSQSRKDKNVFFHTSIALQFHEDRVPVDCKFFL